jgi:hypothetical protein
MLGHGVGHTLAAAQSGGDQLVGVASVALRAGRADRLAAVPARLPEHPVGLAVRRPHPPPTLAVARLDPTAEQDGTGAVARRSAAAPQIADSPAGRRAQPARGRAQGPCAASPSTATTSPCATFSVSWLASIGRRTSISFGRRRSPSAPPRWRLLRMVRRLYRVGERLQDVLRFRNVPLRRIAATARCGSAATRDRLIASLLGFVQLSRERACEAVRRDCSFAKKREFPPGSWSSSKASVAVAQHAGSLLHECRRRLPDLHRRRDVADRIRIRCWRWGRRRARPRPKPGPIRDGRAAQA